LSITVEDALKIGAMKFCKLIAGKNGLYRTVSYIDTMEVPNIKPWLKKNLLLITTGYAIKDNADALSDLIWELKKADAAGLAVKTRFLGGISDKTIELSNRLGVPLIEIPKDVAFVDITMPLIKAIVDEHNKNLKFSERMNQKFLELELNDSGFHGIAKTLSNLIGLPIVIVSRSFSVLATSDEKGYLIPDSVIEPDSQGNPRLSSLISSQINRKDILQRLTVPAYSEIFVRSIAVKKQVCAYICIISRSHSLEDMQLIALNHAATSVALEISKLQKLEEHLNFLQNSLFLDILAGNVKSKDEAKGRANLLHWPDPPIRVAVVNINNFESVCKNISEEQVQKLKENIYHLIRNHLSFKNAIVMIYSDNFVVLLPNSLPASELKLTFEKLCILIKKQYHISVTVGISDFCGSYLDLSVQYEEACDAIAIARTMDSDGPVQVIDNVRLEQAMLKSCSTSYFRKYVTDTIGKLEQYDREHGTNLTNTLDVLIQNMGARQKAAEKLFIHRNTLANRISRIEEITGLDLSQNENLFRLGFALKIRFYL
jgi:PucR family transcriptional regulator, purine catabolism regulatory protein